MHSVLCTVDNPLLSPLLEREALKTDVMYHIIPPQIVAQQNVQFVFTQSQQFQFQIIKSASLCIFF